MLSKYPEQLEFTKILCQHIGAEVNQLCLTNGSAEAIRYIIEAYTRPNGKIVSVVPSYAMYEVYAHMYGRNHVPVNYNDDLTINVDQIIENIKPDIDLIVIVNPNNPIGNTYSYKDMDRIIEASKANNVTVLIDEAYYYFYPNTFIDYALKNEHVFLTRTFSKLFSLAGCRLGFVVGKSDGITLVQKLCTPHNVNAFGIKFAQAIIEEKGMIELLIDNQIEGKSFLIKELYNRGYLFSSKEGNYIFIQPKTNADQLVLKMKRERKILIKTYKEIGSLGKCLRVTTGEKKIMQIFIDAMDELDI